MRITDSNSFPMETALMLNDESQQKGHQVAPADQRQAGSAPRKRTRINSKPRRDKGKKLLTARDRIVLLWIAQQYVARLDQVQQLLSRLPGKGGRPVSPTGLTLSAVLQVVARWVELGLVIYERGDADEPGWVHLTALGLRKLGLPYAPLTPAASSYQHLFYINRVRLELERRHPTYQWTSERTLRAALPRRAEGVSVPHLPDAQVWTPKLVAVEVERSPKSPGELDAILTELLIVGVPAESGEAPLLSTTIWYFVRSNTRASIEAARSRLPEAYRTRVKIYSLETLRPFEQEE
jgi:hypothetical protein